MKKYGVMEIYNGKIISEHNDPQVAYRRTEKLNSRLCASAADTHVAVALTPEYGPYDADGEINAITKYTR